MIVIHGRHSEEGDRRAWWQSVVDGQDAWWHDEASASGGERAHLLSASQPYGVSCH